MKPEYTLEPATDQNEWFLVLPENTTLQGNLELDFNHGLFKNNDKKVIGIHAKGNLIINGGLINIEDDENSPSLWVDGDLHVEYLAEGSAQIEIGGNLRVDTIMIGQYNHGSVTVNGNLDAKLAATESSLKVKGRLNTFLFYSNTNRIEKYIEGKKNEEETCDIKGFFKKNIIRNGNLDFVAARKQVIKGIPITLPKPISLKQSIRKILGKKLDAPENVKTLSLEMKHLGFVPDELQLFTNLEVLNLSFNNLLSIPKEIGRFEKLRELHLNNNGFIELPEEIGNLRNLEILNLSYNCLISLPDSLKKCSSLKIIKLNGNPYSYILRPFHKWKNVRLMFDFPEVLTELNSLTMFNIESTFIRTFPLKPFKSKQLSNIEISETLINKESSAQHPELEVDVESGKEHALSYIEYWTDRDGINGAIASSDWEEAGAILALLVEINIPISEPYDKAIETFKGRLNYLKGQWTKPGKEQFYPEFKPQEFKTKFFQTLLESLLPLEEKYPDNKLIGALKEFLYVVQKDSNG